MLGTCLAGALVRLPRSIGTAGPKDVSAPVLCVPGRRRRGGQHLCRVQ